MPSFSYLLLIDSLHHSNYYVDLNYKSFKTLCAKHQYSCDYILQYYWKITDALHGRISSKRYTCGRFNRKILDTHVDSISRSLAPAVSCMFFRCQFRSWMFFLGRKRSMYFFCLLSLQFVVSAANFKIYLIPKSTTRKHLRSQDHNYNI